MRTPFPRLARLTKADTEVGGVRIPAGQIVLPWLTAANRDERVFAEPDRFDIHRKPNPHLTFGHGIHFCLGAPLARLEARVALRLLLQRYRDIEVAGGRAGRVPQPVDDGGRHQAAAAGTRRLTNCRQAAAVVPGYSQPSRLNSRCSADGRQTISSSANG